MLLLSQVLLEAWACKETPECSLMKYHHSGTRPMKTLKMNKNGLRNQFHNGQGTISSLKDALFPGVTFSSS